MKYRIMKCFVFSFSELRDLREKEKEKEDDDRRKRRDDRVTRLPRERCVVLFMI